MISYARFLSVLFLIVLTAVAPWYLILFFLVLFNVCFSVFWEGILVGFFLDSFYPSPLLFSKIQIGFFSLVSLLAILAVNLAKNFIEGKNLLSKALIIAFGGLVISLFFLIFVYLL